MKNLTILHCCWKSWSPAAAQRSCLMRPDQVSTMRKCSRKKTDPRPDFQTKNCCYCSLVAAKMFVDAGRKNCCWRSRCHRLRLHHLAVVAGRRLLRRRHPAGLLSDQREHPQRHCREHRLTRPREHLLIRHHLKVRRVRHPEEPLGAGFHQCYQVHLQVLRQDHLNRLHRDRLRLHHHRVHRTRHRRLLSRRHHNCPPVARHLADLRILEQIAALLRNRIPERRSQQLPEVAGERLGPVAAVRAEEFLAGSGPESPTPVSLRGSLPREMLHWLRVRCRPGNRTYHSHW